jgi:phosphomethylpyrimidine synthase
MKITEDVRKYAAQQGLADDAVIEHGMEAKAREFQEAGAELYSKP